MRSRFYALSTFIFTFIFWGVSLYSYAQIRANIGLNSGYNSTFVLDKGLDADPRYVSQTTYNFSPIGIALGVDLNPRFALQFKSILSKQGSAL